MKTATKFGWNCDNFSPLQIFSTKGIHNQDTFLSISTSLSIINIFSRSSPSDAVTKRFIIWTARQVLKRFCNKTFSFIFTDESHNSLKKGNFFDHFRFFFRNLKSLDRNSVLGNEAELCDCGVICRPAHVNLSGLTSFSVYYGFL